MEARFHIDKHGEPGQCRAKTRPCPLNGKHYDNIEDAMRVSAARSMGEYDISLKPWEEAERAIVKQNGAQWMPELKVWRMPDQEAYELSKNKIRGDKQGSEEAKEEKRKAVSRMPSIKIPYEAVEVRTLIKQNGGVWNPTHKDWSVPEEHMDEMREALSSWEKKNAPKQPKLYCKCDEMDEDLCPVHSRRSSNPQELEYWGAQFD